MDNIGRGIASLGVVGAACFLAFTDAPGYAFLVALFGLAIIWDNA